MWMSRVVLILIFSERAAWGGGARGGAARLLFFIYFFPCSIDHERDWPPCKVVFFGLVSNALNVRNNNNNDRYFIQIHAKYSTF